MQVIYDNILVVIISQAHDAVLRQLKVSRYFLLAQHQAGETSETHYLSLPSHCVTARL